MFFDSVSETTVCFLLFMSQHFQWWLTQQQTCTALRETATHRLISCLPLGMTILFSGFKRVSLYHVYVYHDKFTHVYFCCHWFFKSFLQIKLQLKIPNFVTLSRFMLAHRDRMCFLFNEVGVAGQPAINCSALTGQAKYFSLSLWLELQLKSSLIYSETWVMHG